MSYLARGKAPYPYHVIINGTGFMVGLPRPGAPQLVSTKSQDISQIQSPDFSYAGLNPLTDREEPYESLTLGMGMKTQEQWQDFRYFDAQAVDLSVWPWCKGPEINKVTGLAVDTTTDLRFFFELGGVLYLAAGRYVFKRAAGEAWSQAHDFGASNQVQNVCVFTSNFDGTQRAWFALSGGVAQYTADGAAYTAMATFHAQAFAVIGREFWWAEDVNRLRKLDTNADPTNEANYTTAFYRVGDKSSPIVNLMVTASSVLLIAKTDGLYTLDRAGDDHSLFPFLRFAVDPLNARAYGQFENDIYVSYASNLLKIAPDFQATEVGPEDQIGYDGPVRGDITAFAGVGMQFAHATVFNPDTKTSYLLKRGGFVSQAVSRSGFFTSAQIISQATSARRVDAWHGSLSDPYTAATFGTIRGLFVSSVGAPVGHTRTYLGYSDGTIGYFTNPCVSNPAACNQYRFHVGDSWVNLPLWTGTFNVSPKSLRHVTVTGPHLSATDYVTFDYDVNPPTGGLVALANNFDQPNLEASPLPHDTVATLAAFRVHLHNAVDTSCPLVSSVSIGHALRPRRVMNVQLAILCADGLVRRDGVMMRLGRQDIQRLVEAAVDTPGAVSCILPDETTEMLSFTDYSVSQSFDEIGRQWRGSLTVKATQWYEAGSGGS